jgi:uncharacterized membrane-anchored protein
MFHSKWDMPPLAVLLMVFGVVMFVLLPGLKLGPIGEVVGGAIALAVAFTMARRVEEKRRATAPAN